MCTNEVRDWDARWKAERARQTSDLRECERERNGVSERERERENANRSFTGCVSLHVCGDGWSPQLRLREVPLTMYLSFSSLLFLLLCAPLPPPLLFVFLLFLLLSRFPASPSPLSSHRRSSDELLKHPNPEQPVRPEEATLFKTGPSSRPSLSVVCTLCRPPSTRREGERDSIRGERARERERGCCTRTHAHTLSLSLSRG